MWTIPDSVILNQHDHAKDLSHILQGQDFKKKVINEKSNFVMLGTSSKLNFLLMWNSLGRKKKEKTFT